MLKKLQQEQQILNERTKKMFGIGDGIDFDNNNDQMVRFKPPRYP